MPEDFDLQAGEYVLGTLGQAERHTLERRLTREPLLQGAVSGWQKRLGSLDAALTPVAPPPALWHSIAAEIPELAARAKLELLQGGAPDKLRSAVARWRSAAVAATAIAATLAVGLVSRELTRVPPAARPNYVAVVNRGGDQPALIVRVDLATGTVLVRPVSTETPENKSLELWVINEGAAPKSMGIIGSDPKKLTVPVIANATFAVTVEQTGGSPDGKPQGPIVYSGKLMME